MSWFLTGFEWSESVEWAKKPRFSWKLSEVRVNTRVHSSEMQWTNNSPSIKLQRSAANELYVWCLSVLQPLMNSGNCFGIIFSVLIKKRRQNSTYRQQKMIEPNTRGSLEWKSESVEWAEIVKISWKLSEKLDWSEKLEWTWVTNSLVRFLYTPASICFTFIQNFPFDSVIITVIRYFCIPLHFLHHTAISQHKKRTQK